MKENTLAFWVKHLPKSVAFGLMAWHFCKYSPFSFEWVRAGLNCNPEFDCREVALSMRDFVGDKSQIEIMRGRYPQRGQTVAEFAALIPVLAIVALVIYLLIAPALRVSIPAPVSDYEIARTFALTSPYDQMALAEAVVAENAYFVAQTHAGTRHGDDAENAHQCIQNGRVQATMYNPSTRRVGEVCEMFGLFFIIIRDAETNREVTAFMKDPQRYQNAESVIEYMKRVGYK